MAEVTMLNARKARASSERVVDLGDGTAVRCRKEDLSVLIFDGRVPMPLLAAVQRMVEMPYASPVDRIASLGANNGRDLITMLREHAVKVILEPKVSMEEDPADADTLSVTYFEMPQLLAIWNASAVVPKVAVAEAATFRVGAGADDADAASTGEGVPPEPEHMAPADSVGQLISQ